MGTMNEVLVFQHVPHETLGTLEAHLAQAGLACRYVELFRGIPAPSELDRAAGLVVLGGPMNVDQVRAYPFLQPEVDRIRDAVMRPLPVLGICLGAQLLAKSLGARVFANPVKEIGWYEIELTAAAAQDPLLQGCPPRATVFQWHGDTFDLPPGAVHLAQSAACRHQAFRYGSRAYALQFHVEMTEAMVEEWLQEPDNCRELADLSHVAPAAIRAQTREGLVQMRQLGDRFLAGFAGLCAGQGTG